MDSRENASASSLAAGDALQGTQWTVADLIDFEYYLDADEQVLREQPTARHALAERDRTIYLEQIAPQVGPETPHTLPHRRISLRRWLTARRAGEEPGMQALLPGGAFATVQRLGTLLLAVLGVLLGVGLASALLHYDGNRPVSVPWYVFLLVIAQFLLVLAAVSAWLFHRLRRDGLAGQDAWLPHRILRPLLTRAARWLQHQHLARSSADVRERALATQGVLKSHYAVYGPVSYLPALIPAQVFGVAFNVGVIFTTLTLEWFTDLAFGWGSSLISDPQTVHHLVRVIAAPWGWLFGEGAGYPSLEQIDGSRVILAQWASDTSGSHLNPDHLRAWSWFLVLAVFTYGLLPRLILLGISVLMQDLALRRLPFTHARIQALYARMLSPCVETQPAPHTAGAEMPIPAPLAPRIPSAGLAHDDQPVSMARPWRETPAPDPTPVLPLTKPAAAIQVEPIVALVAEPPEDRAPAELPAVAPDQPDSVQESQPSALLDTPEQPELEPQPEPQSDPEPSPESQQEPEPEPQADPAPEPPLAPVAALVDTNQATRFAPDACLLLVHVDIDDVLEADDRPRLEQLLIRLTGWHVAAYAVFGAGSAMTQKALAVLDAGDWQAPPPRVAVIQDGSQPPITENLLFLRELRAATGTQAQILLALVGDPDDEDRLPPLRAFEYTDWQRKIDQMADPYLRLDMLASPAEQEQEED